MPNELATVPEAEAKLREELAAERGARVTAERFAMRPPPPPPPPQVPIEDPYDKFTNEGLKMTPEEQRAALDRGTRLRVRQEVAPVIQQIRQELAAGRQEDAYNAAYDAALAANPDMAQNPEQVAAAAAAVEFDVRSKNLNVLPGEYVRRTVAKHRELFKKDAAAAPTPAYVEGSTPPATAAPMTTQKPAEAKPPNPFTEWYGEEVEGMPFDEHAQENLKKMTGDYAEEKNAYLDVKGNRSYIPRVVQPLKKRRKAQAAAAAAAGK